MDSCVGCRGCETACPSAVPFGRLMDQTRSAMVERSRCRLPPSLAPSAVPGAHSSRPPPTGRGDGGGRPTGRTRASAAPSRRAERAAAQRAAALDRRRCRPRHRLRHGRGPARRPCRGDPRARRRGRGGRPPAQLRDAAARSPPTPACATWAVPSSSRLIDSLPPDVPIVVDSAGCSAQLKEAGHLLGTAAARAVARRVRDLTEVLADEADRSPPGGTSTVHEPRSPSRTRATCATSSSVHGAVRTALAPFVDVVELDDDGLCCGAGGAFSFERPLRPPPSGNGSSMPSPAAVPRSWRRPTRDARCTSRPRASPSCTPFNSSTTPSVWHRAELGPAASIRRAGPPTGRGR